VASAQSLDPIVTASATAFDARPWLDDPNQTQQALAKKYANLEWVVFERELNLATLFTETKQRIEAASNASEARAALDRLARKLGDGHVEFQWQAHHGATQPPAADCAALGYNARMFGTPVAALAPGYVPLPRPVAAEEFTAVLQDNHAAVVMGAPTVCAGCGHTDGGTPTRLNNSGGVLEVPDCARFRADGSNEVMGIQPDVLVGLRSVDGPHRQGLRVAAWLPEAVERALRLHGISAAVAR
jgi:hypothetical protein